MICGRSFVIIVDRWLVHGASMMMMMMMMRSLCFFVLGRVMDGQGANLFYEDTLCRIHCHRKCWEVGATVVNHNVPCQ